MAETAAGRAPQESLFVRKATGLLRGWAVRDAFIYATFSINLITLGLFIFSYAPFIPEGSLIFAIILSGVYLIFQAITYASLIAVMPRAGGDYVWISRVLGGGIGFVLAATGWWFILWHWVPIYANILNVEVVAPLAAIAGLDSVVTFFSEPAGIFTASIITAVLASILISLGMRTYARLQQFCFYGGVAGLVIVILLLLINSQTDFISAFNSEAQDVLGATSGNAYQATLDAGGGLGEADPASLPFGPTLLLIPMIVFFNLWSNWGATLYGEVRGASDFRKNVYAMGGALLATSLVAVILLALFAKTFGWDFYYAANNQYWGTIFAYVDNAAFAAWPYPVMLASFLVDNAVLQFLIVAIMSLWFLGWVGSVFLSSTRVVFATAFDRILPEWAARTNKNGVPYAALALMLIPSIPISYLYAYSQDFVTYTLDATLVIAITFLGSAIAAAVLPWRRPEIYNASPIARYKIGGIPLITAAAALFSAFLIFCLVKWWQDDVYGVNNTQSLRYMLGLYLLALVIYVVAKVVRRNQGMDLKMVHSEIPVE
ncbi:MAG TPA: APC family permease [Actinomycetota bacterium]|nr:APC family permease [Actinomycetota bacterium]